MASHLLRNLYRNTHLFSSSQYHPHLYNRSISTTPHLNGWVDKIKTAFTGNKTSTESQSTTQSFTLLKFADEMVTARKLGSLKQYVVGRGSESAVLEVFQKQEGILRFLGGFDPTGENIKLGQKQEAAKKCNCTIQEVESALSKFLWAKEAQKRMEKLKEEGKPMPKSLAEVQKMMGNTPMDVAQSNLAKSGQISRNAMCPCGSKKRYKRCCGEDGKVKH
ncbi:hypothetical protein ACHQM5_015023 [Ranunculus cassubicifolius]